jgi:hypothetical protein
MRLKDARNTMAEKAYEAATSGAAKAAGAGLAGGMGAGAARQQAERADLGPTKPCWLKWQVVLRQQRDQSSA